MLDRGQVVETLLDQEADDAVGVEDEVASVGVLVTDFAARGVESCVSCWD